MCGLFQNILFTDKNRKINKGLKFIKAEDKWWIVFNNFHWQIDDRTGKEALVSQLDRRRIDKSAGVIHFDTLNRVDEAKYICRAINAAGHIDSRGFLDVLSK